MDAASAEHFLRDQIPPRLWPLIPTTLTTAYKAAQTLIDAEPILQVSSASDNRGRIVSWAVDLGFQKLIEGGQWPFDFVWPHFYRPTGRYLKIILSHSILTISQISNPTRQPRDVVFRHNARLSNRQMPLFDLDESEKDVTGLPHFLLLHGYQGLRFAHLGVPNVIHGLDYLYRTRNLMTVPHEVQMDLPPAEDTDIEAVMTLKSEIERWRRDHGG